jgi:predicted DNA-binding transcriptional regulator AlpA
MMQEDDMVSRPVARVGSRLVSNDVVGVAEIAQLLGVARRTAAKYVDLEHFPEPAARLSTGRVWHRADVEQWGRENLPLKTGRPPRDLGPQVLTFVIDTPAGTRHVSLSRELLERMVAHLRAADTTTAKRAAGKIVAETQLHTGSTEVRLAPGEDEAVLATIPLIRADGFRLKVLDRLERELRAAIDASA